MVTQKHEEGNHGDTTNEENTQIVPEKEPEISKKTLRRHTMPIPLAERLVPSKSRLKNKTEKTTNKTWQLTRKNMMLRKAQTTQMRMEQKLNKMVQRKNKNKTCHRKQKENKKGTTLDRKCLPASKQARQ